MTPNNFDPTDQDFWVQRMGLVQPRVLDELAHQINHWAEGKGFNEPPNDFAVAIALMHSELSEALEADRKGLRDDHLLQYEGRVVELADLLIRVLHKCGQHGWPIGEVLMAKMAYNCTSPHKHGKKY